MIYVKPYFYDDFVCKADKCTDTCCAGWEVDVDEISYAKYMNISGDFGKKLHDGITFSDDTACFKLCEGERCVFLDNNGLCDIYSELGEEYLCDICREHPRFYEFFDNVTEMGLGLCCEKVCEMIFSSDSPITFLSEGDNNQPVDKEYSFYSSIRNNCVEIICNRQKALSDRISELLEYAVLVQSEYFTENIDSDCNKEIETLFDSVIELFLKTEPINDDWTAYIHSLEANIKNIVDTAEKINIKEYEYEQLLTYMLYRHFMKSSETGNVLCVVCFCVVNLIFVYLCDLKTFSEAMNFSFADRINNVKFWSKQIEYSDVNTELLMNFATDVIFKG